MTRRESRFARKSVLDNWLRSGARATGRRASDGTGSASSESVGSAEGQRILILGGGYAGLYTALRLRKRLRPGEAHVTVVDPRSYMTYQPFLPEAAAGSL